MKIVGISEAPLAVCAVLLRTALHTGKDTFHFRRDMQAQLGEINVEGKLGYTLVILHSFLI